MEAEQNGATSFDNAVKRKASYHYQGQTLSALPALHILTGEPRNVSFGCCRL